MCIVYTLAVGLFPPYLCNLFSTDWSNHKPLMLKLPDFSPQLKSFHNTAIGILGKAWQKYKLVQRLPVGSSIYWLWCLIVICDVSFWLIFVIDWRKIHWYYGRTVSETLISFLVQATCVHYSSDFRASPDTVRKVHTVEVPALHKARISSCSENHFRIINDILITVWLAMTIIRPFSQKERHYVIRDNRWQWSCVNHKRRRLVCALRDSRYQSCRPAGR